MMGRDVVSHCLGGLDEWLNAPSISNAHSFELSEHHTRCNPAAISQLPTCCDIFEPA
jgi:hypothetical protein